MTGPRRLGGKGKREGSEGPEPWGFGLRESAHGAASVRPARRGSPGAIGSSALTRRALQNVVPVLVALGRVASKRKMSVLVGEPLELRGDPVAARVAVDRGDDGRRRSRQAGNQATEKLE